MVRKLDPPRFTFNIEGKAAPERVQPQKLRNGGVSIVWNKRTRDWQKTCVEQMLKQMGEAEPFSSDDMIGVYMFVELERPKKTKSPIIPRPPLGADLDKYPRALNDAFVKAHKEHFGIEIDDIQLMNLMAVKRWGDKSAVSLQYRLLDEETLQWLLSFMLGFPHRANKR